MTFPDHSRLRCGAPLVRVLSVLDPSSAGPCGGGAAPQDPVLLAQPLESLRFGRERSSVVLRETTASRARAFRGERPRSFTTCRRAGRLHADRAEESRRRHKALRPVVERPSLHPFTKAPGRVRLEACPERPAHSFPTARPSNSPTDFQHASLLVAANRRAGHAQRSRQDAARTEPRRPSLSAPGTCQRD